MKPRILMHLKATCSSSCQTSSRQVRGYFIRNPHVTDSLSWNTICWSTALRTMRATQQIPLASPPHSAVTRYSFSAHREPSDNAAHSLKTCHFVSDSQMRRGRLVFSEQTKGHSRFLAAAFPRTTAVLPGSRHCPTRRRKPRPPAPSAGVPAPVDRRGPARPLPTHRHFSSPQKRATPAGEAKGPAEPGGGRCLGGGWGGQGSRGHGARPGPTATAPRPRAPRQPPSSPAPRSAPAAPRPSRECCGNPWPGRNTGGCGSRPASTASRPPPAARSAPLASARCRLPFI